MSTPGFNEMVAEALTNITVRCAAKEHALRIPMAATFEARRVAAGISVRDLAKLAGAPIAQVNMALDKMSGGKLTLKTILSVADVLGLEIELSVK